MLKCQFFQLKQLIILKKKIDSRILNKGIFFLEKENS